MARLRRAATRTVVACVVAALAPALASGPADATASRGLAVSGTLLVAPAESATGAPAYAVQTDAGALVQVDGAALTGARPGARFTGLVSLPASLRAAAGDPAAALDRAEQQHLRLRVLSATLGAAQAAQAGVKHRWYAAAPSNFGDQGMTDSAILSQIDAVAGYWTTQSNGAITGVTTPTAITRYAAGATSPGGGCGLTGSDFWSVVQEAAAQFPSASFNSTDQLLVLMPTTCVTGGTTGRGGVGALSFGNGGYSISVTNGGYFEPTVAHELGHNYGFGHARLGPCAPACASEYGDRYSLMGVAIIGYLPPPAMSTAYRELQGIIDVGEVETLVGGDSTTTVTRTLQPRSASAGLRGLAIPNPTTGQPVYVDYRSGTGSDAGSYYAATGTSATAYRRGVVVEEVNDTNGTALLPDAGRMALVAGDSRSLADGLVTLSVTSVGATATVSVTIAGGIPGYPTPGAVSLSRTPTVGRSVSAALTGWSPAPTHVSYEWLADGQPIDGATGTTMTPSGSLVGKQLSVRALATAAGYQPASVTSAGQQVAPGTFVITQPPALVGSPRVGSAVSCTPPTWQHPPSTVAMTTLWLVDGLPAPGGFGDSYVPTADQRGALLSCRVALGATGYTSQSADSAAAAVARGMLTGPRPTLRGLPRVGRVLRVHAGSWTPGASLTYRWFASGDRIDAAHGPRLALTADLRGKRIRVTIVASLAGYADAARRSHATRRVLG